MTITERKVVLEEYLYSQKTLEISIYKYSKKIGGSRVTWKAHFQATGGCSPTKD